MWRWQNDRLAGNAGESPYVDVIEYQGTTGKPLLSCHSYIFYGLWSRLLGDCDLEAANLFGSMKVARQEDPDSVVVYGFLANYSCQFGADKIWVLEESNMQGHIVT